MAIVNCLVFYIVCILFMVIGVKVQLNSFNRNNAKKNSRYQREFIQMGGIFGKLYRAY